jgi:hypothetical protein
MAGRSTVMTQLRGTSAAARLRRSPRALCLATALLCALGVLGALSGSLAQPVHPHHRGVAAVALVGVPDGHGAHLRIDHSAVTITTAVLSAHRSSFIAADEGAEATTTDIDSVRTRGPPEPA